jgi:hypothetical protein
MRTMEERTEGLLSELSDIEFESQRMLDDESLRLIAELRCRELLTNEEWNKIKLFLVVEADLSDEQTPLNVTVDEARIYEQGDFIGRNYEVLRVFEGGLGRVYLVAKDDERFVLKTIKVAKKIDTPGRCSSMRPKHGFLSGGIKI